MNVKIFGINTLGKYVASTTLYDYATDSKGNLISDGKGGYVKVSTHKYAMQPIIAKYANSQGISDFVNGLTPDISVKEDVANLLQFGDENETMLKAALDYIKGLKSQSVLIVSNLANSKLLFSSKDQNRFAHEMFVDPLIFTRRTK
jgi:C-terminal processing protease CtpA/Prc